MVPEIVRKLEKDKNLNFSSLVSEVPATTENKFLCRYLKNYEFNSPRVCSTHVWVGTFLVSARIIP